MAVGWSSLPSSEHRAPSSLASPSRSAPSSRPAPSADPTDGTAAGTLRLSRGCGPGLCRASDPLVVEHTAVFLQAESGVPGTLWATDGTWAGTHRVLAPERFRARALVGRAGPRAIVVAQPTARDAGVWSVDPVAGDPRLLGRWGAAPEGSAPAGFAAAALGTVFGTCRGDAWSTWSAPHGGGPPGPVGAPTLHAPCFDELSPRDPLRTVAAVGGDVFFVRGDELWASDGSAEGTRRLATGIAFAPLATVGGSTLLLAGGGRLWRSDGTPEGTLPLTDVLAELLFAGAGAGTKAFLWSFTEHHYLADFGLWVTDGTPEGTRRLDDPESPRFATWQGANAGVVGGDLWIVQPSADGQGRTLWTSDGTTEGTVPLVELAGASIAQDALPDRARFVGTRLFVVLSDFDHAELWSSDGTPSGTHRLAVAPTIDSPFELGGRLLYVVRDGDAAGLWSSDGTPEGTRLVVADWPFPELRTEVGDVAVVGASAFFAARDAAHGHELRVVDEAGVRLAADLLPGPGSSFPGELRAVDGRLWFAADDGVHGREPWVLGRAESGCSPSPRVLCVAPDLAVEMVRREPDGSAHGARAVQLSPRAGAFWFHAPGNLEAAVKIVDGRAYDGRLWLFFAGLTDREHEVTVRDTVSGEAWRHASPEGRTTSVAMAGVPPPTPQGASIVGGAVRVAVAEAAAPALPCTPSPDRLCLADGRFAVELEWTDGEPRPAHARPHASESGWFWFFEGDHPELVVKVLDGRAVNGRFWVFAGALTDLAWRLTVTDTATGVVRRYRSPVGTVSSVADTAAF